MVYIIFILQIVCIFITGLGIYIEFRLGADIGYLLITGGSLLFAISVKLTKIKLLRIIEYLTKQMEEQKDE